MSIEAEKVFFVHLQKYVDTKLQGFDGEWRKKKKVTIEFPSHNDLSQDKAKSDGYKKISEIIKHNKLYFVAMRFLEIEHHLKRFGHLALASADYDANSCIENSRMLIHTSEFFEDRTALRFIDVKNLSDELCDMFGDRSAGKAQRENYTKRLNQIIEILDTPILEYHMTNASDRATVKLNENSKSLRYGTPY